MSLQVSPLFSSNWGHPKKKKKKNQKRGVYFFLVISMTDTSVRTVDGSGMKKNPSIVL